MLYMCRQNLGDIMRVDIIVSLFVCSVNEIFSLITVEVDLVNYIHK